MTDYHHQGVEAALRLLRMPGAVQAYASCLREAEAQHQGYAAFLEALLLQEVDSRRQHQVAHHRRDAHFPLHKTLDAFDFSLRPSVNRLEVLQLATGDWVLTKENCLILGNCVWSIGKALPHFWCNGDPVSKCGGIIRTSFPNNPKGGRLCRSQFCPPCRPKTSRSRMMGTSFF